MRDLSVIIPGRNEEFMARTVEDVLSKKRANTEVIAIMDGYWADPAIPVHPDVTVIHHEIAKGQRQSTNIGVKLSDAEFIMKLDAHCAVDKGFDVKLMDNIEYDWTVVPTMYNLHAFDWECQLCGNRTYQGAEPTECKCTSKPGISYSPSDDQFKKIVVWKEKRNPRSDFMRFDKNLKFQYWRDYKNRPEAKGVNGIADQLCAIGACWFMYRDRYLELGGLDEEHGSWGQVGVEMANKSWRSGGRQVVNMNTWFAHMFRTGGGFGFPYPNHGVKKARKRSRSLWIDNKWEGQKKSHDMEWMLSKFYPVPEWHDNVDPPKKPKITQKKGIIYYTNNQCEERIIQASRRALSKAVNGNMLISVSQYPIEFGNNYVMELESSALSMFKQILKGLEVINTDIVFLTEHDVIYHPSHFDFIPPKSDVYYYNKNVWFLDSKTGQALQFDDIKQVSGLVAYRDLLIKHYKKRVERVEQEGFNRKMGYEPGKTLPHGIDDYKYEYFESEHPNVDIKHNATLTPGRFNIDQYRCKEKIKDSWNLADEIPYWGKTKGKFDSWLRDMMRI